jgi:hypothetical protein
MTQPAKSQEPSMEEILASIRRIIADDDATKSTQRPAEAPKAEMPKTEAPKAAIPSAKPALPERPPTPVSAPRVAPPEPAAAEIGSPQPSVAAEFSSKAGASLSADILDLTESMASPPSAAVLPSTIARSPSGAMPQFQTIDGGSDVGFDEATEKAAPQINDADRQFAANRSEYSGEERAQLLSRDTRAAVDSAFNALAQTVLVQNARTLEDLVREMLRPMLKAWLDDNLPAVVERLVRAEIDRVSRGRTG